MLCDCKIRGCAYHLDGLCQRQATTITDTKRPLRLCRWCLDSLRASRPGEVVTAAHLGVDPLAGTTDLLPGEESERVIFFKRQVPLGQNAVDLLGVTSAGSITVVECKLDCNRGARRTVYRTDFEIWITVMGNGIRRV